MSGTYSGNARGSGYLSKRASCVEATGLSPLALKVILAVMAYERTFGRAPSAGEVREFTGQHDLQLKELVGGRWLETDGHSNAHRAKYVSARPRAWKSLGFTKCEPLLKTAEFGGEA